MDLVVIEDRGHTSPCWIWQGGTTANGNYGRTTHDGKLQPAHRVTYIRKYGPVPDGMHMDHLCRVTLCVNPDHVEPVTPSENTRRGVGTKLTQKDVDEIRAVKTRLLAENPVTCQGKIRRRVPDGDAVREALAAHYGVRADYIKVIWRGEAWR